MPQKLVWDREGAIHQGGGRPTDAFAVYCGQLAAGWVILDCGDCQAKGALERSHRFVHGNFEAGRSFANPLDFQIQLDNWTDKISWRRHPSTRAVVSERLAAEKHRMRPLPVALPDPDRRTGSAAQASHRTPKGSVSTGNPSEVDQLSTGESGPAFNRP